MKKLSFLFVFAFITNFAFTQTIPNGDLENWDSLHSTTTTAYWWQPSAVGTNWLGTLNSLAGLPASAGGPGPVTVYRTTDAFSGTYAAKLVSGSMNLGVTIFIPGMLGTAVMDMLGVRAIIGNPCAGCKPLHFKGYYKFEPVGEDSCAVVAIVSKWNSETHKRDTIGYGKMVQHSAVSAYTPFDIELTYGSISGVPDTLSYLMVSSAGFNVVNFMGSQGNVVSTMYVDEVSLEYPAGIEQSLMPDVGVKVYPNPATEKITVELSDKVENGRLEVFTMDGKSVGTYKLKEVNTTLQVKSLSPGTYYFKLMENNHLLNTGTFLIIK